VTSRTAVPASDVVTVCPLRAVASEGASWVQDGVAVVRRQGHLYAFEELCPHAGVSLVEGQVRHGELRCPLHGGRFRLRDGRVVAGPAERALVCFDLQESGDSLLVRRRSPTVPRAGLRDRLRRLLGR
jgi:3-phenylpropionate/trans-cinnamate dioxygenase ferredoxin subunit